MHIKRGKKPNSGHFRQFRNLSDALRFRKEELLNFHLFPFLKMN